MRKRRTSNKVAPTYREWAEAKGAQFMRKYMSCLKQNGLTLELFPHSQGGFSFRARYIDGRWWPGGRIVTQ